MCIGARGEPTHSIVRYTMELPIEVKFRNWKKVPCNEAMWGKMHLPIHFKLCIRVLAVYKHNISTKPIYISIWICINQILFMSIMYEFVWLCVPYALAQFEAVGDTAAAVSMYTLSQHQ